MRLGKVDGTIIKVIIMPKHVNPNETSLKIKTFYPVVGSIADYKKNITDILSAISARNFTRADAIKWMVGEYKASEEFCRKLLDIFKSLGLITLIGKHYKLAAPAQDYLKTGHNGILAWLLIDRVIGFSELFDILSEKGSINKFALRAEWEEKVRVKVSPNQFDHRINWLRGLGYVDVVARNYYLSNQGLKLDAEIKQKTATTIQEKERISHQELENSVKIIGEFFEFQTSARPSINDVLPSYALKLTKGNRHLDCLWVKYIPFGGKIKFPIEVHLSGNLADTIDRLETVSEYVQKAVIITDEEQERKIMDRLKVKKSRLMDKLVIVNIEDVYKAVQATSVLKSFTTKIFIE